MEELLKELKFDREEINYLLNDLKEYSYYNVVSIVELLKKYNCHIDFIKEICMNRADIFLIDKDRLEYILDAIVASGDIIEETLFELL